MKKLLLISVLLTLSACIFTNEKSKGEVINILIYGKGGRLGQNTIKLKKAIDKLGYRKLNDYGVESVLYNDNNDGITAEYIVPLEAMKVEEVVSGMTKEYQIKKLYFAEMFSEGYINTLKKYNIILKHIYFDENESLLKEIVILPNEDL